MKIFAIVLFLAMALGSQVPLVAQSAVRSPTVRIAAVTSSSGAAAGVGGAHQAVLRQLQTSLRAERGIYGIPVELTIADDGSSPAGAVAEARRAIADGAHVILCCSTEAATRAVQNVAEEAQVLLVSPTVTPEIASASLVWAFSVQPSTRKHIQNVILHLSGSGASSLALMAPETPLGEEARAAVRLLLGPGSLHLSANERYPSDARVLTPEALWVATRQPGGVLLWGHERDTAVALDALERRGWTGNVFINPALVDPASGRANLAPLAGTLVSVSPLALGSATGAEAARYRQAIPRVAQGTYGVHGAYAWDAMLLVRRALELTLSYGIQLDESAFAWALRDALIGLPRSEGAAATYDYTETDRVGVEARSLALGRITSAGLRPLD